MSGDAPRQRLLAGLEALSMPATPQQLDALLGLAERVEAWGRRINLSGHGSTLEVVQGLVLESAALLAAAPGFSSLADLGSGAGFPGLPVAILRPGVRVTLVESRERRHHFQRAVRRELGLANVEPRLGRAEAIPAALHQAAVAQAMAEPSRVLGWMLRWVEPGGWLLLPRSAGAPALEAPPGSRFEELRSYRVPCGGPERALWIGRRE